MIIAMASGKGGTGKTTIATNVAATLARMGRRVQLLDGDVEAPNCHLFLRPEIRSSTPVTVPIPVVDQDRCLRCGACADFCQSGAILLLGDRVIVLPELCSGCGGCALVCPERAIKEEPREVGTLDVGLADGIGFARGRLTIGEARAVPIIAALRRHEHHAETVLIDAPPGTTCPMLEAVKDADFVCLVAEPTPFGLSDLRLALGAIEQLGVPAGVVVNRAGLGDDRVNRFCAEQGIEILAEIPDDRRAAEACSRGDLLVNVLPGYVERFADLAIRLEQRARSRPARTTRTPT